jgi:hypothetical protein
MVMVDVSVPDRPPVPVFTRARRGDPDAPAVFDLAVRDPSRPGFVYIAAQNKILLERAPCQLSSDEAAVRIGMSFSAAVLEVQPQRHIELLREHRLGVALPAGEEVALVRLLLDLVVRGEIILAGLKMPVDADATFTAFAPEVLDMYTFRLGDDIALPLGKDGVEYTRLTVFSPSEWASLNKRPSSPSDRTDATPPDATVPTLTFEGDAGRRPVFSEATLRAWFRIRVGSYPKNATPPTGRMDYRAAVHYFDKVPHRVFNQVRPEVVPNDWKKPGPRTSK